MKKKRKEIIYRLQAYVSINKVGHTHLYYALKSNKVSGASYITQPLAFLSMNNLANLRYTLFGKDGVSWIERYWRKNPEACIKDTKRILSIEGVPQ